MKRTRKPVFLALGVVAILVGAVWMGQGLNLIPGSFMTGDPKWFVIGAICALLGLVALFVGLGRKTDGSARP